MGVGHSIWGWLGREWLLGRCASAQVLHRISSYCLSYVGRICACAAFIHAVGVAYQVIILILVTTLFFLGLALLLGSPTCAQYLSQTILHFSIAVCKVGLERLFLARTLNLLLTPPVEISAELILTKDAAFWGWCMVKFWKLITWPKSCNDVLLRRVRSESARLLAAAPNFMVTTALQFSFVHCDVRGWRLIYRRWCSSGCTQLCRGFEMDWLFFWLWVKICRTIL